MYFPFGIIEFLESIEFPVTQNRLPPLNALKSFEVYGRHLNLKEAAEELGVTESAVSRQLKQIEDYLGAKLFEKVGRNNQLTEKGHEYLAIVSQNLKEIATHTDLMFPKNLPRSQTKKLTLGVYPVFAEYWLLPRMGKLQKAFPDLDLEIHFNNLNEYYAPLPDVDLEIFLGEVQDQTAKSIKLHRLHDFAICNPELIQIFHDNAYKTIYQAEKIHEGSYHWWPRWLKKVGLNEKSNNSGPLIQDETYPIKLAQQGLGLAIGDHISCHELLKNDQVIRPIPEIEITDNWINLLLPKQNSGNKLRDDLCAWFVEEMKLFNQSLKDYQA